MLVGCPIQLLNVVALPGDLYVPNSGGFDQPQLVAGDVDPSPNGGKVNDKELFNRENHDRTLKSLMCNSRYINKLISKTMK